MGRELRMVPPNYEHPKTMRANGQVGYQPMFDQLFSDAVTEWKEGFLKWENGERPEYYEPSSDGIEPEFWDYYGPPPEREFYRSWKDEEATWFQVWETVSEGTPVTPPFATKEELIDYLVANGDFWDQKRRADKRNGRDLGCINCDPWSRKKAEAFVNGPGWAPSFVVDGKGVRSGVEAISDSSN